MSQHVYLTQHGYDRIKSEIEELKTNGRKEAARAIGEAREKGDLSENAEYDAAKDAQGMLEAKIADLEGKISGARIIDETMINNSSVGVLTNVKIENQKTKKQITYKLVPEAEADISTGKISVSSPVGKGLLGKVVGEIAHVTTPNGFLEFKVLEITVG
jgi:transcription elongation factor GreA